MNIIALGGINCVRRLSGPDVTVDGDNYIWGAYGFRGAVKNLMTRGRDRGGVI